MDAMTSARIEINHRGGILHALLSGRVCPSSIRLAFLDIASCCLEHNVSRLLLEDRCYFRGSAHLKPKDVFELSLCFSEWFRGRQVAYVCPQTGFDLGLGMMTCKANGLEIEWFGTYEQGLSWLLHSPIASSVTDQPTKRLVKRQLVS